MTAETYTPREGSLAARVVAHVRAVGPMSFVDVAEKWGVERRNINTMLRPAMQHGVLVKTTDEETGLTCIALPDGGATAEAPAAPAKKRGAAGRKKANARPRGARKPDARPVAEPPPPPIAALWDDGDIILHNLQINGDGTATIAADQAVRLYSFLSRIVPTLAVEEVAEA